MEFISYFDLSAQMSNTTLDLTRFQLEMIFEFLFNFIIFVISELGTYTFLMIFIVRE